MQQGRLRLLRHVWHVFGFLIISFALVISAVRLSTPYLNRHYSGLQLFLESQLKVPVKTNRIIFRWQGSLLVASLNQIEVYDENNEHLIALADSVKLFVHPLKSLLTGKIYFKEIVVHGLHTSLQQNETGSYEVKGFNMRPSEALNAGGWRDLIQSWLARWPMDGIKLVDTNIHVITNEGGSWPLSDIGIHIKKESRYIVMSALATVLNEKEPTHLAVRAKADLQDVTQPIVAHTSIYHLPLSAIPWPADFYSGGTALQGHASFQTWIKFSHNTLQQMDVQFYLDEIGMQQTSPVEQTHQLSGLLRYEQGAPTQWKISASQIKLDHNEAFSFQLEKQQDASPYLFKIKDLALQPWWLLLNQYPKMQENIPTKLKSLPLSGNLAYAAGMITPAAEGQPWQYAINAGFTQLNIGQIAALPGISNINLMLNLDEMGGFANIQTDKSLLFYSNLSDQPLLITDVNLPIAWFQRENGWLIQSGQLTAKLDAEPLMAYLSVEVPRDGNIEPEIAWYAPHLLMNRVQYNFPTTALDDPASLEWIKTATIQGLCSQVNGFYRGQAAEFPFSKQQGRFELVAEANDVYFNYDPDWPAITQGNLKVTLANQKVQFDLLHGNIADSPIQQANATILDVGTPILQIDGNVKSDFDKVFFVLKNSKILPKEEVLDINLKGEVALNLGLTIPIGNHDPVLVKGKATIQDATYTLEPMALVINQIAGQAEFNNEALNTKELQGIFLGQPVVGNLSLAYPGSTYELIIHGNSMGLTQDIFKWLQYQPGNWVQGQSPFSFIWQQRGGTGDKDTQHLTLESPLLDVELIGPLPFSKKKGAAMPVKADIAWNTDQTVSLALSGDQLSGFFKWNQSQEKWDMLGGQLIMGSDQTAEYPKSDKLDVVMKMPAADCVTWYDFGQQVGLGSLVTATDKQVEFDLDISELSCFLEFGSVQLIGTQSQDELKATLIGENVSGTVIQPLNSWKDVVQIKLDKLKLNTKPEFNQQVIQEVRLTSAYQLAIKELTWSSKVLKDFELEGAPIAEGFQIKHVQATSYQTYFNAAGAWMYAPRQTVLKGAVTSPNISQFVQSWEIPGSIRAGQAEVPFDLSWSGNPWQFELAHLSGSLEVDMKSGQIVGVEPGIGRVLSLFNLDTIKRRLKLDFSDLFKEGLAFDSLKANTTLQEGRVSTANLQLKAPSSTIGGDLVLDWPKDQVSGTLYVSPNISGSIPVAAAIAAGNPAVGAAFWALEKLMSKKNTTVPEAPTGRYVYQLSGTLSNPLLTEKDIKATQSL